MLEALSSSIQAHLEPDLLLPQYRTHWTPENPTQGFCSVASEAAYFLLGGPREGWVAMFGLDHTQGTHWWLERRSPSGIERFDPTAEQYLSQGQTPPYHTGRPGGFMGQRQAPNHPFGFDRQPGRRAGLLLERIFKEQGLPLTHEGVDIEGDMEASDPEGWLRQ